MPELDYLESDHQRDRHEVGEYEDPSSELLEPVHRVVPLRIVLHVPSSLLIVIDPVSAYNARDGCQSDLETQDLDHSFVHVDFQLRELVL